MKILFVGDVVGKKGQEALHQYLPSLKSQYKPQVTIVNAENIADGRGITEKLYKWVLSLGVDVITLGNHAFDQREIFDFIDGAKNLVRPWNLPATTPGKGVHYHKVNQYELAVINLLGAVFMGPCIEPFHFLQDLIKEVRQRTPFIFIDCHAEASSEKQALAYWLDGQITALVGTHTHIQTNDARVLSGGTGYLTDVGMTGAYDSIIGFNPQTVIQRFRSQLPTRLEQAQGSACQLCACLIEVNDNTGLTQKIHPLYLHDSKPSSERKYRHV